MKIFLLKIIVVLGLVIFTPVIMIYEYIQTLYYIFSGFWRVKDIFFDSQAIQGNIKIVDQFRNVVFEKWGATKKIPHIIKKMHVHEVTVEKDEIIIRLLGTKRNEKLIKKLKTRGRNV